MRKALLVSAILATSTPLANAHGYQNQGLGLNINGLGITIGPAGVSIWEQPTYYYRAPIITAPIPHYNNWNNYSVPYQNYNYQHYNDNHNNQNNHGRWNGGNNRKNWNNGHQHHHDDD